MNLNLIGPFQVNNPFGTEIAFAKGLKRMGHGVNTVDPNVESQFKAIDRDADATVVFKSCVGHEDRLLRGLRGPVVVYQPDDARFPHIREMMLMMRRHADLFLSFDDHGAEVAKSMGYRAAETLLLTADDELYCPSPVPVERDIDVSFIGSLGDPVAHASRRRMCEIVAEEAHSRGWVFKYGTTQDMPTILDTYRRSKVVLNHATDVGQPFGYGYGLQCRHFEVGMTRTALLSNTVYNAPTGLPFLSFDSEQSLVPVLELAIRDHEKFGRWLYDHTMDRHRPNHRAAQLVDFIERNR
jgi:hypothetical protein